MPQGYADPSHDPADPMFQQRQTHVSAGSGAATAYCVRLCDGRYFPLQRQAAASPVELCKTFCPASRTKVFFGSEIDGARAQDGSRYAGIEHAFLYRQRIIPDCTCNGQTHFGLATIDAAKDPTLRPGDLIAGKGRLMAYRGTRQRGANETAEFTPVDKSRVAREAGNVAVAGRN
jgi:hypothetical protein